MDAINFSLAIDNFVAGEYRHLEPHKSVFDLDKPFAVSANLSMPKPVIATVSNFMHDTNDMVDPVKLAKMEHLFID